MDHITPTILPDSFCSCDIYRYKTICEDEADFIVSHNKVYYLDDTLSANYYDRETHCCILPKEFDPDKHYLKISKNKLRPSGMSDYIKTIRATSLFKSDVD